MTNSSSEVSEELLDLLKEMEKGIKARRKKMVAERGVSSKEWEALESKLKPLMMRIVRKERAKVTLIEALNNSVRGLEYWDEILDITFERLKMEAPRKQVSIMLLLNYLALSEGVFSELVQIFTYILVENDHDIYDPFGMKFAKDYRELDEISFFIKLQFIEKHGFKNVIDAFDRKLRNCIAHLRYYLEEDGTLVYNKTRLSLRGLMGKLVKLWVMVMIMETAFSATFATSFKKVLKYE